MRHGKISLSKIFWIFILLCILSSCIDSYKEEQENDINSSYSNKVFRLISSSENKVFDSEIRSYAKKERIKIDIVYDDTLKIIKRLNNGEKFDSVWLSNSIWMYAIDSNKVKVSDTKSTNINPIVLGIRKNKAEELGFIDKDIYTKNIVEAVKNGKLKFSIPNPVTTDSGASAYLGVLTTLAGNPEVLTESMLEDDTLKENLKTFFSGVERSVGDEEVLQELFLKGEYDAIFTQESSIININKSLSKSGKETLYAIYPVDGVSISDSPIGFIDQKNEKKKDQYDKLVSYLLSNDGQKLLASYGRRTWYGGINENADVSVFNPEWGINTKKYISPLKYPSTKVIKEALMLYQTSLRKPVHVVFCLDYSGSMYGEGISELRDAMDYILTERAEEEMLQFSEEDIVDIVPFAGTTEVWHSDKNGDLKSLLNKINSKSPDGATALFPAAVQALKLLKDTNRNKYNTSVIVMTDGQGNVGYFKDVESYYKSIKTEIPIYSIKFGDADEEQLLQMAELSNGRVFDGTTSLVEAFTEVRGYN